MQPHKRSEGHWIIISRMATLDTGAITGDPNFKRTRKYPEMAWTGDSWERFSNKSNIPFHHALEFETEDAANQYIIENQSKLSSAR